MKKRICIISMAIAFCLTLSAGVWAEEAEKPVNQKIIVNEKENSITFVSPTSDASLLSTVDELPSFNDVADDSWYSMFVSHLTQIGVINGMTPTEFDPNKEVTRAEFAKMVTMAADINLSDYTGTTAFTDVAVDSWYAPSIQWANENKIILGKSAAAFAPEENITREEAAVMVYRLAKFQESDIFKLNKYELSETAKRELTESEIKETLALIEEKSFNDESAISGWAMDGVKAIKTAGIIIGDTAKLFHPTSFILRSECAKMLSAYILYHMKPTFYVEGTPPISYEEIDSETDDVSLNESVPEYNPHGLSSFSDALESNIIEKDEASLSWKWETHRAITDQGALMILNRSSDGSSLYTMLNEYVDGQYGLQVAVNYARITDSIENQSGTYMAHFYDGERGRSYYPKNNPNNYDPNEKNAYKFFNTHYYWAKCDYQAGNRIGAYMNLGMALHFLEDLNNPHHAALVISTGDSSNHVQYEKWVQGRYGEFLENYAPNESYNYVQNSTFIDMSNNFSGLAKQSYDSCSKFNSSAYQAAAYKSTKANLVRTQRAVAGMLYRFLINTHRV